MNWYSLSFPPGRSVTTRSGMLLNAMRSLGTTRVTFRRRKEKKAEEGRSGVDWVPGKLSRTCMYDDKHDVLR